MFNEGFVDLRMDAQHRQSDDTVWPSFTDIMTVVVMIFLFALIVILVRNVELVNQLRATMEAERAAAEVARTTEEQKASLSAQLVALEEKLSALRLQLLQSQEKQQETSTQLANRSQELTTTQRERDQLRIQARELVAQRDSLNSRLAAEQNQKDALAKANTQLEQQSQSLRNELVAAQQLQTRQQVEINKLRENQSGQEQKLLSLRGEYTTLKKKYDRLVRPARTALGKYVVEVKYQKVAGKFVIGVREPKQEQYLDMNSDDMHRYLSQLKQRWGNKLYTKIVIPDNSGLSYSEAWQFTNDVLSKYDYYYQ